MMLRVALELISDEDNVEEGELLIVENEDDSDDLRASYDVSLTLGEDTMWGYVTDWDREDTFTWELVRRAIVAAT